MYDRLLDLLVRLHTAHSVEGHFLDVDHHVDVLLLAGGLVNASIIDRFVVLEQVVAVHSHVAAVCK